MATAVAQKDKSLVQILGERDTALLDVKLTLDEFSKLVTVSDNESPRWYSWRVQGDVDLYYWIYDHTIHDKAKNEKLSDVQVIECAYEIFRAIQERKGQLNFHTIYVQDCEEIECVPRKQMKEYATVRVVKDCIDGLYRFSTSYSVGNGGISYAPSFERTENITESRNDAILKGAQEIYSSVESSWEAKADTETYNPFLNKILKFIETVEAEIRQPSLFG